MIPNGKYCTVIIYDTKDDDDEMVEAMETAEFFNDDDGDDDEDDDDDQHDLDLEDMDEVVFEAISFDSSSS